MSKEGLVKELQAQATKLRKQSLFVMKEMGGGWLGGSFSSADLVTTLLFHKMRHDAGNPRWVDRDRLIISKAHCCELYYAALAELGYFPKEQLTTYSKICSNLQVHVDSRTPGVECSGGSLGLGLSFAAGVALGAYISPQGKNLSASVRAHSARYRVYCILGDGECNEGEVWEAAANAAHYRLDNLTAIIDNNKFQSTGPVEEKMNLMPLAGIFKAFGWETIDINGNDFLEVIDALDWTETATEKPQAIVAHTVKGKGFPGLEATNCHFVKITDQLLQNGLEALDI